MEKKMTVMGVAAKIAVPAVIYAAVTEAVSLLARPVFSITDNYTALLVTGLALVVVGFGLNLLAALEMLKATREKRLAKGLYNVFRDPMYVLQIFLTFPGLLLLLNSWLVLTTVIPAYILYKAFVREEHDYLEAKFGDEYREYLKKVPIKL
jgi:protein-S-isoprenylcysteine O-methyltransferase Ste14